MFDKSVKRLLVGIIQRAVSDYQDKNMKAIRDKEMRIKVKEEAAQWLGSEDCKYYCEFLGIDYNAILRALGIDKRRIAV